jgi:hypothetical protein
MPRQRLHLHGSALAALVARLLAVVLGAALVFYGAMLVLLAFKVGPGTVDSISGYRTAFDHLAGLEPADVGGTDRAIVAAVGLSVFLLVALLVWRGLPRPHLGRHAVVVAAAEDGETEVQPRAIERVVELAARGDPRVSGARARFDENGLVLDLEVRDAATLVETLRSAQERAREGLRRHELEVGHVGVTLAAYNGTKRRELA